MKFSDYEKAIEPTVVYKNIDLRIPSLQGLTYVTLGLNSEVGEIAGKAQKLIRDSNGILTHKIKRKILLECGDALWFLARTAHEIGYTMQDVAEANLDKVLSRLDRGVLGGEGDNR